MVFQQGHQRTRADVLGDIQLGLEDDPMPGERPGSDEPPVVYNLVAPNRDLMMFGACAELPNVVQRVPDPHHEAKVT